MAMKVWFYLLLTCFFVACSPVRYVGIETYNPSEITFPEHVRKLLIVNNAVPQPDDVGYSYVLYGVQQDTARLLMDSVFYYTTYSLGKTIVEGDFFEDVLLYDKNIRTDQLYLSDQKLTQEEVRALCDETGADAVLTFDKLLFDVDKDIVALSGGFVLGSQKILMAGMVRGYVPERDRPLASLQVVDSVYWTENAYNLEELAFYIPPVNDALRVAGQYIGAKVTPYFIPHWQKETRWYYVSPGSRWKEASAFAGSEKWNEASLRWNAIFETSSSWKERAKAASNIALYHEMKTDLKTAYDWAHKSYELFRKFAGEKDKYTEIQKLYLEALAARIHADQKLKMQFGE